MKVSGKILIIDDEDSLRKTLARILQQAGFEVMTAESGEQGLEYLDSLHFDLVYLDLRMPGLAGLDALNLIHMHYPVLPVVLFTAQPDVNSAVEALRRGATDYLLKPLKPEVVIERTKSILASQQKERRKREIQSQIEALQAELRSLDRDEVVGPVASPLNSAADRFLKCGELMLDLHARRLKKGAQVISPPPTSFDYLLVLARHAPNVVDYQTLVTEAQGYLASEQEARELVKWHIHQLRQAIEADVRKPAYLINVRGIGYRLVGD
ncbi:MAG: response regulator transcription factor [Anaerolineales bacterium]|nr:response regulator transcription factor [Anaerolineales bacterium]